MNPVTSARADAEGISRMALHRAVERGELIRIARGIYIPSDAPAVDWDLIEAVTQRGDATICLRSALAYHELTDEIPESLDIAIPRGARIPTGSATIKWHTFDKSSFDLGRELLPIPGSDLQIGLYSAPRSIVDAFRLRGDVGYELARDALKEWLRRGGKPIEIVELAMQIPRAKKAVLQALEILT